MTSVERVNPLSYIQELNSLREYIITYNENNKKEQKNHILTHCIESIDNIAILGGLSPIMSSETCIYTDCFNEICMLLQLLTDLSNQKKDKNDNPILYIIEQLNNIANILHKLNAS